VVILHIKDCIILLSKDDSLGGLFDKHYQSVEKLFGIFIQPGAESLSFGNIKKPLGTFKEARAVIKRIANEIGCLDGEIIAYFREGRYPVTSTEEFTVVDSGREDCTIVFKGYPGEKAVFDGGMTVMGSDFKPVTDKATLSKIPVSARKYVMVVDLMEHGYVQSDTSGDPGSAKIFYNGDSMTLSRWPNHSYAKTGEILRNGAEAKPGIKFVTTATKEQIAAWSRAKNPWFWGMWKWEWAPSNHPMHEFDVENRAIGSTDVWEDYVPVLTNMNYYVYNLIEELDAENEYFIDRDTNKLYLIPYQSHVTDGRWKNEDKIQIPILSTQMFLFTGAKYIKLENLNMENSLGYMVDIIEGTEHITVYGCDISNSSGTGVAVENGTYHITVQSCDIHGTNTGVSLGGGNIHDLIPAYNLMDNCRVFSTTGTAYSVNHKAYWIEATHNEIFDTHHHAVNLLGGAHLIFQYNEVYDALGDRQGDAGYIYQGRVSHSVDNVISDNYFHAEGFQGMGFIYLDDHIPGFTIERNIFYKCGRPLFVHGGERNFFNNNIGVHAFYTGDFGYYQQSDRYEWDPDTRDAIKADSGWPDRLKEIDVYTDKWVETYPEVERFYRRGFCEFPEYSVAERNVQLFDPKLVDENDLPGMIGVSSQIPEGTVKLENNYGTVNPDDIGFVDLENRNFNLKEDAKIYENVPGFEPLKFDEMGTYIDEYRTSHPQIEPFDLIAPANGEANIEAREVTFLWQRPTESRKYLFELATDSEFKYIIREAEVLGNSYTVKNLRYGNSQYYWRVFAIDQDQKHISEGTKVRCAPEYYTFQTMENETLNLLVAEETLEMAEAKFATVEEGDKPGQFFEGVKDSLAKAIDDLKAVLADKKMTQRKLNMAVDDFKKIDTNINGKRNPEVIYLNDWLKNFSEWSFQENVAYSTDNGGITWTRTSAGHNACAGYKAKMIENYQIVKFNARLDWENKDAWGYFGLRSPDTTAGYHGGVYGFFIKQDIFELQKFGIGTNFFLTAPNDGIVEFGKEYTFEIAALDQSDGSVRLIMKVDGQTIFDYIDDEIGKTRSEPGYFTVYSTEVNNTITLLPAPKDSVVAEETVTE